MGRAREYVEPFPLLTITRLESRDRVTAKDSNLTVYS